jgi:hypothetical protein
VLGAGCSADAPTPKDGDTVTSQTGTETIQAHWDLSKPTTPAHLGSRFDDVVIAETLGREGVDAQIRLPGGDVVSGMFRTVTASTGREATIATVDLASVRLQNGAWEARIDQFVTRFGGDRAAIDAYLDEIIPAIAGGAVDPKRNFPGQARPGYEPALQLRPDAEGVVVNYQFSLIHTR